MVATVALHPDEIWKGSEGSCTVEEPPYVSASAVYLSIERVVDPERFVPGKRDAGFTIDGRLRLAQIVTDHGSRFDDQVIDSEWDAACDLRTEFCAVPSINEQTPFFANEGCTDRIWRLECTRPTHLFLSGIERVLDPYAGPVFHDAGHGSLICAAWDEAVDDPETVSYYRAGQQVEQGHMRAGASWTLRGSERLRLRNLANAGGGVWPIANWLTSDARYHDTVLDVDCAPFWRKDGDAYCLGVGVPQLRESEGQFGFYSDPQCSAPAAFCSACDRAVVVGDDGESRLVRLTPQSGAYFKQGAECIFDPENQATTKLGDSIPWDEQPRFTQTDRPPSAAP
jgi:hypothetical protein